MGIGKRLQELFNENGVTPYYVSGKTNISEPTLSRILNGKTSKPRPLTIDKLAEHFNVYPKWILTGEGDKLCDIKTNDPIEPYKKPNQNILSKAERIELINLAKKIVEISERNSKTLEKISEIEAQNSKNLEKLIIELTRENT